MKKFYIQISSDDLFPQDGTLTCWSGDAERIGQGLLFIVRDSLVNPEMSFYKNLYKAPCVRIIDRSSLQQLFGKGKINVNSEAEEILLAIRKNELETLPAYHEEFRKFQVEYTKKLARANGCGYSLRDLAEHVHLSHDSVKRYLNSLDDHERIIATLESVYSERDVAHTREGRNKSSTQELRTEFLNLLEPYLNERAS